MILFSFITLQSYFFIKLKIILLYTNKFKINVIYYLLLIKLLYNN